MKSFLFSDPMACANVERRKTQTRRLCLITGDDGVQTHDQLEIEAGGGHFVWREVARPTNPPARGYEFRWNHKTDSERNFWEYSPLAPGELFYQRETWARCRACGLPIYRAANGECAELSKTDKAFRWRSPLHLRPEDARWFGRIVNVRVERVQDITEADAQQEGLSWVPSTWGVPGLANVWAATAREAFKALWEHLHGHGSWERNDWVWVNTYEPVTRETALSKD